MFRAMKEAIRRAAWVPVPVPSGFALGPARMASDGVARAADAALGGLLDTLWGPDDV